MLVGGQVRGRGVEQIGLAGDDAAQDVHCGVAGDRVRDGRAELVLLLHCRFILLLETFKRN